MRVLVVALVLALAGCGGVAAEPDARRDAARADARRPDADIDGAPRDRFVFVTSQSFSGNLGGLAGADARCMAAASAAALPGFYMAWLADSTGSPATRMTRGASRFRLTNGLTIATGWADLTDGTIETRIDRNEFGGITPPAFVCQGGEVWTNTTVAGTVRAATDCNDWSSGADTSTAGNVMFVDGNWTESSCVSIGCGSALPLYCFEQ